MANRDFKRYSGNRYSLRAKTYHMIKRIDALSNRLGALGDLLVTTWLGAILAILTTAGGIGLIVKAVSSNNFATVGKNWLAILLFFAGTILIALNAVLTNPSMGSQLMVSIKFIYKKFIDRNKSRENIDLRPYRMTEGINDNSIFEKGEGNNKKYLIAYKVKGAVSPVTFENELNQLATLNNQLLGDIERDSILVTINSIQQTKPLPKKLPPNATPAMIRKRDINFQITSQLKYNQQLNTTIILTSPNLDVLRSRKESIENVFNRGLVIGYVQLVDKELKKAVQDIYG
ncbi:hypothetical protein ACTPGW_002600 [Enterococcus faecalis]